MDTQEKPLDKRLKQAHPERIKVGSKTFERNDVVAGKYGESERSVNRRDPHGAPYIFFGNIKYRPQPDYDDFILSGIKQHKPSKAAARKQRGAA